MHPNLIFILLAAIGFQLGGCASSPSKAKHYGSASYQVCAVTTLNH